MRLLLFSILLMAGLALAQQTPPDSSAPEQTTSVTETPQPAAASPTPSRSANTPYLPSEEISEDLSVSFPVDI